MNVSCLRDDFYYVVIKAAHGTSWLADERVKKHFLDRLIKVKEKQVFRMYAFCVLDREAHFLLSVPQGRPVERITGKMTQELQKSYGVYMPGGREEAVADYSPLPLCSMAKVIEMICRIHLLGRSCAGKLQDYWWSSYMEYLRKNVTGLIETDRILENLDAEPHLALQKFVRYHQRYDSSEENQERDGACSEAIQEGGGLHCSET